jgi:hypothetical protein
MNLETRVERVQTRLQSTIGFRDLFKEEAEKMALYDMELELQSQANVAMLKERRMESREPIMMEEPKPMPRMSGY